MADGSIGTVSLDLVLENNIAEQLGKVQNQVKQPVQQLGESIKSSIEAPIKKSAENVQKTLGSAFEETPKTVQKTTDKMAELFNKTVTVDKSGKNVQYDSKAIEEYIEAYDGLNKKTEKADEQIQKTFNKLKDFKIPTTPLERLKTELENTRTKSELLKAEWEQLANSDPSEKVTAKMLSLRQQIIATNKAAERLESDFKRTENLDSGILTGEYAPPEKTFERLQRQFELTNQKIESVSRTWQQLQIDLQNTNDAQSALKIRDKIAQTENQLISLSNTADRYKQKMDSFGSETASAVNTQFQGIFNKLKNFKIPTTPTENLQIELENTRTKIALLQRQWQELSTAEPSEKVVSQMLKLQQQIISTQKAAKHLESQLEAGKVAFSTIEKVGSKAFGVLKSVGRKSLDSLKSRFGFLNKSAISLTKPVKKLGTTLKNTFRRVFVMATLYAAVKAIKNSFSEILKSNDELSKSLNDIKANLSIAFTPIIQAVMPALNTMMSGLARATKYIAGFMAGLFGMTYKQAAEATKKLHDTGKQAADTAKKASMSMAGIDEMNILSDNSDDSKNEEDTGIDYDSLDMSEPEFPDWAERLKQAIKSGDWYGVGEILVERVNAVFGGIDWENVEKKVTDGVNRICDFINGFVDNINWEYLGNTFAGGINTITSAVNAFSDNIHWEIIGSGLAEGLNQAVNKIEWKQLGRSLSAEIRILTDLLYGFVTEFDWKRLGKGIGEAINGWFDGIDFGKLGTTLSEGIKGIFSTITVTLQTVDFGSIGGKIAGFVNNIDIAGILSEFASSVSGLVTGLLDFLISFVEQTDWLSLGEQIFDGITGMLQNIDWNGVITKAFELLGSVVGGASALISGILTKAWEALKKAWNSVKDYFNKKIEENGGNVIKGVWKGILDALKNVGNWIKEHIFKPFMEGFKKAFGIHSPSKEMATMGGFIISGLFNAISDGITKIREIFKKMLNVIKSIFLNIDKWFRQKFQIAWNNIKSIFKDVGTWFKDRWDDITGIFSAVGSWFGEHFANAWDNIKGAFKDVWNFFNDKWENIKSIFSNVGEWFSEKFKSAFDNIKNAFSDIGNFFSGIWEDVSNKAKDGINWLLGRVEDGLNKIIDGLNWFGFDLPDVMGGGHIGFDLNYVNLPRLANGGLATAPTLAMVGDNKNARTDPEVIAPLSKLEGMLGDNSEITELLKIIIELLKSGMNIEIINYMFRNSREFSREVIKAVAEDNTRKGGK